GATSPPWSEAPTHTPYSWAVFSSRVIAPMRASTLAVTGTLGSFHRGSPGVFSTAMSVFTFLLRLSAPRPGTHGRTDRWTSRTGHGAETVRAPRSGTRASASAWAAAPGHAPGPGVGQRPNPAVRPLSS